MKIRLMFLLAAIWTSSLSAQNYSIDWYVIASGGGHSESANYQADGTIGQPIVGNSSSQNYSLQSGFWAGGEQGSGSPCGFYVIGDYNGNETFNVADIIAAFSKLQTGSPDAALLCECPPGGGIIWAVAMDVNNNCIFNVADVIAGFSRLQTGAPLLVACELCPPGTPMPPSPGDGGNILVMPRLESKAKIVPRLGSQ